MGAPKLYFPASTIAHSVDILCYLQQIRDQIHQQSLPIHGYLLLVIFNRQILIFPKQIVDKWKAGDFTGVENICSRVRYYEGHFALYTLR